jgi:hypothetical protein
VTARADLTIDNSAIVLRSPSAAEVFRVWGAFERLFKKKPRITLRGHFPARAIHEESEANNYRRDGLNLLNPRAPVVVERVGRVYLVLDLGRPLGLVSVDPRAGVNVEVRLTLPARERPETERPESRAARGPS